MSTGFHNLSRSQMIGTLTGLLLALALAALDQTIVGTAMPRIIAQLNGFALSKAIEARQLPPELASEVLRCVTITPAAKLYPRRRT